MRHWAALTALFYSLSACSVASVQEAPSTIAHNECQNSGDCAGGSCSSDNQCRSSSTALQSVLFEVTPPADGSAIAGVQFLIPNEHLGVADSDTSLPLGSVSQVVGKVTADGRACTPKFVGSTGGIAATTDDLSVPARVSLTPTSGALGLYSPRAVVQSNLIGGSSWTFTANIAPGTYDIYVEPRPQPDQSCPVPPLLLRDQELQSGTPSLEIALPEPSLFEFHVSWPLGDGALNGWMVDMLDPASAHVVSNRVPLTLRRGSKTDYVANISYDPVVVVVNGLPTTPQQDQLLRLSPPDGLPESAALPTVLLARSALGLFSAGRGTLTNFTSLPSPVHVHGQVTSRSTPVPVAATVTLVAKTITGIDPGVLTSFVRTASVGDDGQFDVYLLPGTYRVLTVPQSPLDPSFGDETPLAADTRDWIVPSTPEEQAGKVIGLADSLSVTGAVVDATDNAVATAQVQAVASPLSVQADALQQALAGAPLVPRASADAVASDGGFRLKTDPGTFDISVRPNANTGFAWLVLPNVPVTSASAGLNLGRVRMSWPVSYGGTVTQGVDGPPVPGALVRAYVYSEGNEYTADASHADSLLQIAEARANAAGVFQLLVPAELNRLPE